MNKIEEQLWNYIDGNCTATEKKEIEAKIASNLQYNATYKELSQVHAELSQLDLDEPSLSFTRNVMEQVKQELRPVALKTKVDTRIIYAIGGFFLTSILFLLGYAASSANLSFNFKMPKINLNFEALAHLDPTFLTVFIMFDALLVLLCIDSYLRRLRAKKTGRTVG